MTGLELAVLILGVIVMFSGVFEVTRQILTVETTDSLWRQLAVYTLAAAPWVVLGVVLIWLGSPGVAR